MEEQRGRTGHLRALSTRVLKHIYKIKYWLNIPEHYLESLKQIKN